MSDEVHVTPTQYGLMQQEIYNPMRTSYENARAALRVAGLTDEQIDERRFKETKIVVRFGRPHE